MNRYLSTVLCALVTITLGMGVMGCEKQRKRERPAEDEMQDVGLADVEVDTDTHEPPPRDDAGPNPEIDADESIDVQDETDTDPIEEAARPREGHQICAVAGRSSNDEIVAVHCLGAHDASGFQAHNEQGVWQPGALQVFTQ